MVLPDDELSKLLIFLYYYGSFKFPHKFWLEGGSYEHLPEIGLITKKLVVVGQLQPIAKRTQLGSTLKGHEVLLQCTKKAQDLVTQLGDENPVRLAQLHIQVGQFDQAASYIEALSLKELAPFLVSEWSVIREIALIRYKGLTDVKV